jgi:hypothetical protein
VPAAIAAGAEHAALRIARAGMIDRADRDVAAGGERRGHERREDEHSHRANIGAPPVPIQPRRRMAVIATRPLWQRREMR